MKWFNGFNGFKWFKDSHRFNGFNDSNDVWVNRIWIRFEKSLFSLQSNHGIVHRERNHIANVHLQPIAAFHMTQHVASRQTNQSMKQTRDMLIASMSHCVNWSMQHTPEPNNSGIHSIKFSSTLDSPYFPQPFFSITCVSVTLSESFAEQFNSK